MTIEVEMAQRQFTNAGGIHAAALIKARKAGQIPLEGETAFHEYPKMLRISLGKHDVPWQTESVKGVTLSGIKVGVELFDEIIVKDEDEHERYLSGGKTDAQLREEKQEYQLRLKATGARVDPTWSTPRLRRELGEAVDNASLRTPQDELADLDAKIKHMTELVAKQAQLEALRAQLSAPPRAVPDAEIAPVKLVAAGAGVEAMKAKLAAAGVAVKPTWDAGRIADELAAVTK